MTNTETVQIAAGDIVRKGNGKTEYRVVKVVLDRGIDAITGEVVTITKAALVKTTTVTVPSRFALVSLRKLTKVEQ